MVLLGFSGVMESGGRSGWSLLESANIPQLGMGVAVGIDEAECLCKNLGNPSAPQSLLLIGLPYHVREERQNSAANRLNTKLR